MNVIKKIFLYGLLISCMQLDASSTKNAPEFDKLMQEFAQDFQKFAHVFLHGSKEERKHLKDVGAKSLSSSAHLYNYVKLHPHEKRSIPKEHRDALEHTVRTMPQPTKKGIQYVQEKQDELQKLIASFIKTTKTIPVYSAKSQTVYKKSMQKSVVALFRLSKFIQKNKGLLINEPQQHDLIEAIESLKKQRQSHADKIQKAKDRKQVAPVKKAAKQSVSKKATTATSSQQPVSSSTQAQHPTTPVASSSAPVTHDQPKVAIKDKVVSKKNALKAKAQAMIKQRVQQKIAAAHPAPAVTAPSAPTYQEPTITQESRKSR